MSDSEEMHEDYYPKHGINSHPWEITYSHDEDETEYIYWGTVHGVKKEMHRIFDDNFDGGIDSEGNAPVIPTLWAMCASCDITIDMGTRNKY
jgi:hypothetical protein